MLQRFSSRQANGQLGGNLLGALLPTAKRYDRIAGFFRSSLLEVAGEAIDAMPGKIRIVCNSDLNPIDVLYAKRAQDRLRQEWCAAVDAITDPAAPPIRSRFAHLAELLQSGKLEVRVLADQHFGLIHGKAGVVEDISGKQRCFIGSANESKTAWSLNYEMVWVDDDPESVAWVQAEFDSLWNSLDCVKLPDFVAEECERMGRRSPPMTLPAWQAAPTPAAAFVEAPVYRKQVGLWPHQKQFVELAFRLHRRPTAGARLVLADQVGLGKTIQLGMAAALMALHSRKPVLVLAPRTLLAQWQDDLWNLLGVPSAWWDGTVWHDERGELQPRRGAGSVRGCPRQIAIVSTGLVLRSDSQAAKDLLDGSYACVILDEAHRARRGNLGEGCEHETGEANNLLRFCRDISTRTKSFLLGTATPIQLHPIELWDLLDALNRGDESVLGQFMLSPWLRQPADALAIQTGALQLEEDLAAVWPWLATPLPEAGDDPAFARIRQALGVDDSTLHLGLAAYNELPPARKQEVARLASRVSEFSPFVRCVVRRTREQLETQIDPETGEPRLKKIAVQLHGERDNDALQLPTYLTGAYEAATEFCRLLATRQRGSGFMKTLLLRRVGSSIEAGRLTAEKMLDSWQEAIVPDEDDDDEPEERAAPRAPSEPKTAKTKAPPDMTAEEREALTRFRQELDTNRDNDPKLAEVRKYLIDEHWLADGCIIFSQYFATAHWLATELSNELPALEIGLYAGSGRSGVFLGGVRQAKSRDWLKDQVKDGKLKLIIGTDAAAEGLNLQTLGTLINLDLPWNPTRLEQRKGRIQRIGQLQATIKIANLRYRGSVEDQVHQALSARLKAVHDVFGQIPDTLEDVWVDTALGKRDDAARRITQIEDRQPFKLKWSEPKYFDWESCATVLAQSAFEQALRAGWRDGKGNGEGAT